MGVDQYINGFEQAGDVPSWQNEVYEMEELKTMHTQLIEWAEFVVFVIALARFVSAEMVRLLLDVRFFFRGSHRSRKCYAALPSWRSPASSTSQRISSACSAPERQEAARLRERSE
jgi:hypothetical protein